MGTASCRLTVRFQSATQIFPVNLNPCDNQFVLARWEFPCKKRSVRDRVHAYLALVVGMDVRRVMFLDIRKNIRMRIP